MTSEQSRTVIEQLASKATGFGFPNNPSGAAVVEVVALSRNVWSARVSGLVSGFNVFALVVVKPHQPVAAAHVVDFRIGGSDPYTLPPE